MHSLLGMMPRPRSNYPKGFMKTVRVLCFVGLFLLQLPLSAKVHAQTAVQSHVPQSIRVQGAGMAEQQPDQVRFSFTFGRSGRDITPLQLSINSDVEQFVKKIQPHIGKGDLDNASIRVYQEHRNEPTDAVTFRVERDVTVVLRDLTKYAAVMAFASHPGVTQVQTPEPMIANAAPLYDKALQLAFNDAKAKATLLAKAAGRSLGPVLNISEQGSSPAPRMKMAMMAAESVQFSNNKVQAELSVEFLLQDAE